MKDAMAALLRTYHDKHPDRGNARGYCPIAILTIDQKGLPVDKDPVAISSFAWGLAPALAGRLGALADWRTAEGRLKECAADALQRYDEDGQQSPVDVASIHAVYEALCAEMNLPVELREAPSFALRVEQLFVVKTPPEPSLLNSFFLDDLSKATILADRNELTPSLRQYLGVNKPASVTDLLKSPEELEKSVAPALMPLGRWPSNGRHPLVLLQQAAVNLALREFKDKEEGLFAINGPPGTGKTTLLRDLVAANVVERALRMVEFSDPAAAFKDSGQRLTSSGAEVCLYSIDPRIRGFEMLVASSNNAAVENISKEMPGLDQIADDAPELRYFRTISEALLNADGQTPTWGLIAAVMGKRSNIGIFRGRAWSSADLGLNSYLSAVCGNIVQVECVDHETGETGSRPAAVIEQEGAPIGHEQALERWKLARAAFRRAVEAAGKVLGDLERCRQDLQQRMPLASAALKLKEASEVAEATRRAALEQLAAKEAARALAIGALDAAHQSLRQNDGLRPSFWARLVQTAAYRQWKRQRGTVEAQLAGAQANQQRANDQLQAARSALSGANERLTLSRQQHQNAEQLAAECEARILAATTALGVHYIDETFFGREHADKHKTSPWLTPDVQRLRDAVFITAMQLHRAFIDAAAEQIRANLSALFGVASLDKPERRPLVPDLWSTLFLVVPIVSSTFASIDRMLRLLPANSLGWLFIDEAGQAVPQAATGALMRARRAVIVGDPLQIEPVVSLPTTLNEKICDQFRVNNERWTGPNASVQTLADQAGRYVTTLHQSFGHRSVGVPLLVHRRCQRKPMFDVSNQIAYNNLMVYATPQRKSSLRDHLGTSRWLDVADANPGRWSEAEGNVVIQLLRRAQARSPDQGPDIYVISPFRVVAGNLRTHISNLIPGIGGVDVNAAEWCKVHVGTVHTFQGKEADSVIFVLGATGESDAGAREWAGSTPNIVNVAVSRAKENLYVVGSHAIWRDVGFFKPLASALPVVDFGTDNRQ